MTLNSKGDNRLMPKIPEKHYLHEKAIWFVGEKGLTQHKADSPLLSLLTLFAEKYVNIGRDAQGSVGNVLQQGGFAFPEKKGGRFFKTMAHIKRGLGPSQLSHPRIIRRMI